MPPSRKLLVAIAAGVAIAAPPVAGFNLWLNHLVDRQGQEELDVTAGRSIGLAEGRVSRALATLEALAGRGVDSCRVPHIDAMRQATFATTPVKEHSIIAPDGRTLCSDVGGPLEPRKVISSERIAADSDVLIEVVRVGDRQEPLVRLRRPGSGNANGLAALIPSNLFVARVSQRPGPATGHVRMTTRSGALISELGKPPDADDDDRVTGKRGSARYALDVTASLPRDSVLVSQGDLRALGTVLSGLLAILILALSLLMPKRARDNPVAELERALKAGEFIPYYQPIVDIRSGRLRGAEVLIRWRKPDGSIVSPASFIPLAEFERADHRNDPQLDAARVPGGWRGIRAAAALQGRVQPHGPALRQRGHRRGRAPNLQQVPDPAVASRA